MSKISKSLIQGWTDRKIIFKLMKDLRIIMPTAYIFNCNINSRLKLILNNFFNKITLC